MAISYRPHDLYALQAAGSGTPVALDYRYDGTQNRMVFCSKNTADTITVEVSPDGTNFFPYYTFAAGVTSAAVTVVGPALSIRATKVGTAATCSVTMVG